jgi:hypothetical protein
MERQLTKLGSFGIGTTTFAENHTRFIDEENDMYPPPLMSRSPSCKSKGFGKLTSALMYMCVNRVRQLLIETHKETIPTADEEKKILDVECYHSSKFSVFGQDGYRRNILGLITLSNHPTNLNYENNKESYEEMFFTVLRNIRPDHLVKLFNDLCVNKVAFNSLQITEVFKDLSDRPHMMIAIWNYGLKYSENDVKDYTHEPLKKMLRETMNKSFSPSKRYYLILQKCPIKLSTISTPAILTDGTVYEYSAIKKHLENFDTNPLTNERLVCHSNSYMRKRNGEWIGKEVSAKVLYLPEKDSFEHFDFLGELD